MSKSSPPPVTIGYKYFIGMHLVVCHPIDELLSIMAEDRLVWSGNVTTSQEIYINSPELFGGELKQGGVQGYVDVLMGEPTQPQNSYLSALHNSVVPAFRGLFSVVLKQVYMSAMTPYFKNLSFLVKSIPAKSWYSETADINSGSANPIHIIYECWTNKDWGIGAPASEIDDISFKAAALTCFNESFGLSIKLEGQVSIDKFIFTILSHCNGMLYLIPATNKIGVKLLRYDYDIPSLQAFNEDSIISILSYEVISPAEIVNEIVVKYRPRGTAKDVPVTVQNLASVQSEGAVISETVVYSGIDNASNANRVALRDLQQKSSSLSKIVFKVNRSGWVIPIGGVFKLSWLKYNINAFVFRVLKIELGSLTNSEITITAALDIFGLPVDSYIGNQLTLWENPIKPAIALSVVNLQDANYYQMMMVVGSFVDRFTNTSAFLLASVGETVQFMSNVELWTSLSTVYDFAIRGHACSYCITSSAISKTQTVIPITGQTKSYSSIRVGDYAYLGNELVRIDDISTPNFITIGRGCLHTVPKNHVLNTLLIFSEQSNMLNLVEYVETDILNVKALMRTPQDLFPLASAAVNSHTFKSTFGSPYPPGNLKLAVDSTDPAIPVIEAYPVHISGPTIFTWSHRDRLLQTVKPIADTTYGNIGPETGTQYIFKILTNGINSVVNTTISGTTYTFDPASINYLASPYLNGYNTLLIELSAIRDGFESVQKHSFTLDQSGLGFQLGNYLGG